MSALDSDVAARLKRDANGLFAVVVQERGTGQVLTPAGSLVFAQTGQTLSELSGRHASQQFSPAAGSRCTAAAQSSLFGRQGQMTTCSPARKV